MRKFRGMSRGFTLIELLIVLAVIAALLAIVTPVALNAVRQANATRVVTTMRNIRSALESYVYIEKPATPSQISIGTLVNSKYLSSNPGNDFTLTVSNWGTTGTATATITYNGGISASDLQKIYPEINNNKQLVFEIAKYW